MLELLPFRKSKNLYIYSNRFSSKYKLQFYAKRIYNFCDYFINPFNFVKSRIGQLLILRCFIIEVALYKHVFITCIVLDVMIFCDKSNLLTFVQNVVNIPMFDKKLSSSTLQFLNITYIPLVFVGVLISLTN